MHSLYIVVTSSIKSKHKPMVTQRGDVQKWQKLDVELYALR